MAPINQQDLILDRTGGQLSRVANILGKQSVLLHNWSSLARQLRVGESEIQKLRRDFLLDKIDFHDLITALLQLWQRSENDSARISVLCDALEEIGLRAASEKISLEMVRGHSETPHDRQCQSISSNTRETRWSTEEILDSSIRPGQLIATTPKLLSLWEPD